MIIHEMIHSMSMVGYTDLDYLQGKKDDEKKQAK